MEVKAFKKTITAAANLSAADTSEGVYIFTFPPDCYVLGIFGRVKTVFAGVTVPMVEVGVPGDTTRFMPKQRIDALQDLLISPIINSYGAFCPKQHVDSQSGSRVQRNVIATFRSSSGNMADMSAGEIDFVVVYAE